MKPAFSQSEKLPDAPDFDKIIKALLYKDDSPLASHTPKWLELRTEDDIAKLCDKDDPATIKRFASEWLKQPKVDLREKIAGRGEAFCDDPYFASYSVRQLALGVLAIRRKATELGIPPDVMLKGYMQTKWGALHSLWPERLDWWQKHTPPSGNEHWVKWWEKLLKGTGWKHPFSSNPFDSHGEDLLREIKYLFQLLDDVWQRFGMLVLKMVWSGQPEPLAALSKVLRDLINTGTQRLPAEARYVTFPNMAPILDAFYWLCAENHKLPIRDEVRGGAVALKKSAKIEGGIPLLYREITPLGLTGLPRKVAKKRESPIKRVSGPRR